MSARRKTVRHKPAKIFYTFVAVFLAVMLCGNIYALAGSSATGIYETVHATGIYKNWDGVTNVAQFAGPDGNLYFAVDSDSSVAVYKTSNGTLVSGKVTLKKQHPTFGTVVCDADGYYYMVTGEKNSTNDATVNTFFISKYDSKGNHIKTVGDPGGTGSGNSNTKKPFDAGNCDAAIKDGILTVLYAREMYSGHQSCTTYSVNTSDLSKVQLGEFYQSHSFAQRVVPSADGFIYMSEGDCYSRTFTVQKVKVSNGQLATYPTECGIFDFWVRDGAFDDYNMYDINENFAHMGGIAVLSNGNVAFAAQSAKSLNSNAKTESEEIFLQIFNPDENLRDASAYVTVGERSGLAGPNGRTQVTNYGVKWLTSYGNNYTVSNVQIVALPSKEVMVLYELKSDKYQGVYYILLNEAGNVTLPATRFDATARLNPCETPIVKNGKVYWVGNKSGDSNNQLYIYTLDPTSVKRTLMIHEQPQSATVTTGTKVTMSVTATGQGTLKYQWQCKAPGSSSWSNSTQTGATTSKLSVTTTGNHDGYQYRCVITDGDGKTKTSNTATLTVKPKITTQPASRTVAVGNTATFSVEAVGKATLKYQWQCKAPGATTWTNSTQSGATTTKLYVTTNVNHNGYQYRCAVTDGSGRTVYSSAATLTIVPKIKTQPADKSVRIGDTATFSVTATGQATLTYQWQCKAPGSSSWSNSTQTGAKTSKLSVTTNVNHHGYQYRCVVTDGNGKKSYSGAATLTILPKITVQPKSTKVNLGTTATFSVTAKGVATLKYQWQCKEPNATSWRNSALTDAKKATLSIKTDSGYEGYQYRCVITDGDGKQVTSDAVTLTLIMPGILTQPKSVTVAVGNTATFSVTAKGKATLQYQWQAKGPGASGWTNSSQSGATTSKLSVATNVNHHGYQYRCIVTDGDGRQTISGTATLTIVPKITTQPADRNVAVGTKATFSVTANGQATLKYQWQYLATNTSTWQNSTQSGATTSKLTITTTVNHQAYRYRCVVTDGNGKKTVSAEAMLTLYNIPITEQCFPDAVFREYVSSEFDRDGDGKLSAAEIADATYIYLYDMNIADLKGISFFRNLDQLMCAQNKLTSLNLRGLTVLTYLRCYTNQLTSLDISDCTELQSISCNTNRLTSLKVTQCTKLRSLNFYENQLTTIDVSKCPALQYIYAYDNNLTKLDVSKCPVLSYCYVSFDMEVIGANSEAHVVAY